jgi:hypothetical protein
MGKKVSGPTDSLLGLQNISIVRKITNETEKKQQQRKNKRLNILQLRE